MPSNQAKQLKAVAMVLTIGLMAALFSGRAGAQTPPAKNPKLDSALADLVAAARVSATSAQELAEAQSLRLAAGRVQVQLVTHPAGVANVTQAVTGRGGAVTGVAYGDTVVQAWLPVTAIEPVAGAADVYFVRRPHQAFPLENLRVGNSTTEALAVFNGPAWHAAGITGSGIKVGLIDAGFSGYTGLQGVDLPGSITVKNFVDGESDAQADGTSEHGTACAEIIHDIAPGAQLYLAKIYTDVDLAEAVAWLISQEVDVISTSIGFYNATPGDGTGPIASLVSQARDAGILWVTAAGNDREAHWGGGYKDGDGDKLHEFANGEEVNCFVSPLLGGEECSNFVLEQFNIFVRWDDWEQVNQDYDLELVRWNGTSWQVVASSTNPQTGGPGQTPTEWISAPVFDLAPYGLRLKRVSGSRPVHFELFTPQLFLIRLDEIVNARSIANLADSPGAMTVAALNVAAPYPQEPYSAEGPTNGPGGTATGGFLKPDIGGFANVSTESYGAGVFNGTSSATPHVAGAAALVKSAFPAFSPEQVQNFLEGRAVDMGAPGVDTQVGYGRLSLGAPPAGINTAPILTGLPDQTVPLNGGLDNAIDLWAYAEDAQDADEALTFSISNAPVISAGVTIEASRFVDVNPLPGWSGSTTVEIQVEDSGGLFAKDAFAVTVSGESEPAFRLYLPLLLKTGS